MVGVYLEHRTTGWRLQLRGAFDTLSAGTVSFANIQNWHFVYLVRWLFGQCFVAWRGVILCCRCLDARSGGRRGKKRGCHGMVGNPP